MAIVTSIAFLSLLAAPAAAFWRLPCKSPLVVERADPIIAPGNVSGHVHQIMGGNGFDFDMDYADTQASTCTSCTVHGDFSNYWTPVLYYQHQNGTFEKVDQVGGGLVYYLQRTGPNNDKLQAFPEGFRMISGDPYKRASTNDFASQAVSYNCLDYDKQGGNPETGAFPTMNCPDGLRTQVFFPSCWDGTNLDSADHKSHMSFPIGAYNDGACPDTHPVHLVSIFYEIIWDSNKFKDMWYGSSQPFVWAMGDPTGYGFHGDFIMGWDRDILQRAVDQCTNDSGQVEDCPVFTLYPDSTAEGCMIPSKVNEDIQGPMAKLPGCNPVQNGPDRAQVILTCDGNNATIGTGAPLFKDLTSSGWDYQGCGTDDYFARALTGASTSQDNMTNEECVNFCSDKGFSIAGSEYSQECYCGNSIPTSAQPVAGVPGTCNMPCAGDATQNCGGYGKLSLYQKCTGSSCSNAAGFGSSNSASTSSSITNSTSVAGSSSTSHQSSTQSPGTVTAISLTTTTLAARGTSSSSSGTKVSISATTTVSTTSSTSSTTSAKSSVATTSAVSSSSKAASTTTTSTVSSSSSAPTNPTSGLTTNWSYLACVADTLNPRTLPNEAPYTIDGNPMTSTSCVTWCSTNGYKFAGTEYGAECWCSNSIPDSAQKLDEAKCNMACKGDQSQKCGGPSALSLFYDKSGMPQNSTLATWVKRDEAKVSDVAGMMKDHSRRHEHGSRRYARGL